MLCKPSLAILVVSVAGALFHLLDGNNLALLSWTLTGIVGTASFEILCMGGLEPLAWLFMMLPILGVCFFISVALFASNMRIETVGECSNLKPRRVHRPETCDCDEDGHVAEHANDGCLMDSRRD